MRRWLVAAAAALPVIAVAEPPASPTVDAGRKVSLEYTLTLQDGSVVESNVAGKPFAYEQGKGQIIPGLEKALLGLKAGDKKKVTVAPEEGYGPVRSDAQRVVPLEKIPEQARKVGATIAAEGFPGSIRVAEVSKDTALLDFNHPLAGKTLNFDVHILTVQ
jgi:FKBP-type peptidyl-prolyl cis-trans isomerase SlyD